MAPKIPYNKIMEYDPNSMSTIARRQIERLKNRMECSGRPDAYIYEINKIIYSEATKK